MIELHHVETFAGAACCKITELPNYKAAPLKALRNLSTSSAHFRFSFTIPRI